MGISLRQSVRKYHTVSRCAKGLRYASDEAKAKAVENVEGVGHVYLDHFMEELTPTVPVVSGPLVMPTISTRSRSRSPVKPSREDGGTEIPVDFVGRRVARNFYGDIFFGTVSGRVRGPVVAGRGANGTQLLEAVWNVDYDDGDNEQMNRVELVAALRTYRSNYQKDPRKSRLSEFDFETNIEESSVEAQVEDGVTSEGPMWGTDTDFLDPKYNLLDLLTPTATQNRLSYLVELVIDQAAKHISNEAVKLRLRKDAAAFGAKDMPTDVRSISRHLGARTLAEVTRHRCGNDACSYAWIGAVSPSNFKAEDVCPECGTPRYKTVGAGLLKPQRVFYYFGAANVVEALHRHPSFQENWKKNVDITMNAFRSSPDGERLNEATFGAALAQDNGLYISMADGFQSHDSKTQSITGKLSIAHKNASQ
jgi:hypothetical protein